MKCRIITSLVRDAHPYTRSKLPWKLESDRNVHGENSKGVRFVWKLFHYISGGGMKAFGRTIQQEERNARQNRFLTVASVMTVLWILFLFV